MEPPTSGETILSDSLHLTPISTPIDPPATQEVEQPTLCEREKDNSITQATELHSAASSERSIATVTLDREELQCILIGVTHKAKECPSQTRVSQPGDSGAAGEWVVEQKDCEICQANATAEVGIKHVIARDTSDIRDMNGNIAVGVIPVKYCRQEGHQRGVHGKLKDIVYKGRFLVKPLIIRLSHDCIDKLLYRYTFILALHLDARQILRIFHRRPAT
jgi:hypothetical protein